MAAVPALLLSLLIFPVMGLFLPRHLLGWFDGQRVIFFSSEIDTSHIILASTWRTRDPPTQRKKKVTVE
jgi:hypothetical protein